MFVFQFYSQLLLLFDFFFDDHSMVSLDLSMKTWHYLSSQQFSFDFIISTTTSFKKCRRQRRTRCSSRRFRRRRSSLCLSAEIRRAKNFPSTAVELPSLSSEARLGRNKIPNRKLRPKLWLKCQWKDLQSNERIHSLMLFSKTKVAIMLKIYKRRVKK